jgi:hypothetical protein
MSMGGAENFAPPIFLKGRAFPLVAGDLRPESISAPLKVEGRSGVFACEDFSERRFFPQ